MNTKAGFMFAVTWKTGILPRVYIGLGQHRGEFAVSLDCLCGWGSDLVGWPTGAPPSTVPSLTGLASLPLEELRILASGLDAT